mmetsp:Transcript_26665/g.67014  ORF Transcript_26665/g.67014 Transcript_26665/m.67014 type:complete len:656 (-) Transcript_26665:43-2010(-)
MSGSANVTKAVVLADTFQRRFQFHPITEECPKSLIPLVGVPLLDYTITSLASAGIREVIVACRREEICEHVKEMWGPIQNVKVTSMLAQNCFTEGDILRELFSRDLIGSDNDFILMGGDVITNMKFDKILADHKERRANDKRTMMTMTFRQVDRGSKPDDAIVLTLDPTTKQMLSYETRAKGASVKLPLDLFKDHPSVDVLGNLVDCRIDVCSPEVLSVMSDHFDYEHLRNDFVRELVNEDIVGYKFYASFIEGEYSCRVADIPSYHTVSQAILSRWTFPFVPDTNFQGNTNYKYTRGKYFDGDVKLDRTCVLSNSNVALGQGTSVGEYAVVHRSVIGSNCTLESGCQITNSIIWDDVTIGANTVITNSVVCSRARIGANCRLAEGCVVSLGVIIGNSVTLPANTRVTRAEFNVEDDESFADERNVTTVAIDLGEGGVGHQWVEEMEAPPDDADSDNEAGSESSEEEELKGPTCFEYFEHDVNRTHLFQEVYDIIHSNQENAAMGNLISEIRTRWPAYNQALNIERPDIAAMAMFSVLDLIDMSSASTAKQRLDVIKKAMKKWMAVISAFVKAVDEQVDLIYAVKHFCGMPDHAAIKGSFQTILKILYDLDVLGEEAVLTWATEMEESCLDLDREFLKQCSKFITWLKEASEEDD